MNKIKVLGLITFIFINTKIIAQTTDFVLPIINGLTVNACAGVIRDNGGTANYANNCKGFLTILPSQSGSRVKVDFTLFGTEEVADTLYIYNGADTTAAKLLAKVSGAPVIADGKMVRSGSNAYICPSQFTSSESNGALTFYFKSNATTRFAGFEATISCVAPAGKPDLTVVKPLSNLGSVAPGGQVNVTSYLKNVGATSSISLFTMNYFLSKNTTFEPGDVILDGTMLEAPAPGDSTLISSTVNIPLSVATGDWYLLFFADNYNEVDEASESNNIAYVPLKVVQQNPDYTPLNASVTPPTVSEGAQLSYSLDVKNIGLADAGMESRFAVYLSKDSVFDVGTDFYVANQIIDPLIVNQQRAVSGRVTIADTLSGKWYAIFNVNDDNALTEESATNNYVIRPFQVIKPNVDLIVSFVSGPMQQVSGTIFEPGITVKNQGNTASGAYKVATYISTDTAYSSNDTFLGFVDGAALATNATQSFYPNYTVPTSLAAGDYYLVAYADYNSQVAESNENNNTKSKAIKIVAPTVDLQITSVSALNSPMIAGTQQIVYATIKNNGTSTASTSDVSYFISKDNVYNTGDVKLLDVLGTSLAASAQANKQNNVTIPDTLAGAYYLLAVADVNNRENEFSETNNVISVAVQITASYVDLSIIQASVPTSVVKGQSFALGAYIANSGDKLASSSNVGFYLSSNNTLEGTDYFLGSVTGGQLGTTNAYRSMTVTVPSSFTAGPYFIISKADHSEFVTESVETNNTYASAISITNPTVDFYLYSNSVTATVVKGSQITPYVYVYNGGSTTSSTSTLGYYLSKNTILDAGDLLLGTYNTSAIGAGSYQYAYTSFSFPDTLKAGTYYLFWSADYNNQVGETNETNNTAYSTITINDITQNLYPNSSSLSPTTVVPGTSLTSYTYVYNNGNTASGASSIAYYLSTDNVYSSNDVLLSSTTLNAISTGSYQYLTRALTIPSGTAVGNYYILIFADYQNTLTETSETDNVAALALSVVNSNVDLSIYSPAGATTVIRGNTLALSTTVYNGGNAVSGTFSQGYYLSKNTTLESGDLFLGWTNATSAAAGNYTYPSLTVTIPDTVTPGSYYVLHVADYDNKVLETNETNNLSSRTLTVQDRTIDLYPQTYSVPVTGVIGNSFSAASYVYNQGTLTSGAFEYKCYLSTNATYEQTDLLVSTQVVNGVSGANSASYVTSTFVVPNTLAAGTYYLLFYADASNIIAESNETNNVVASVAITISPAVADLQFYSRSYSATGAVPGGQVSVYAYPYNLGTKASDSTRVGYYLSANATLEGTDLLIGSSYLQGIAAGNYGNAYNGSVTIPTTVAPGTYYLIFNIDYLNRVPESNKTNNVYVGAAFSVLNPVVNYTITNASFSPAATVQGGSVTVVSYVYNYGSTQSPVSKIGYYLSSNTTFETSDLLIGTYDVPTIGPSSSSYQTRLVNIPSNTPLGSYYILHVADADKKVTETNENDNVAYSTSMLTVSAYTVDLQHNTYTVSPASTPAGSTLNLTTRMFNNGTTMTPSSNMGFYLSSNTTIETTDVLLGTYTYPTITASSYSAVYYPTVTLPSNLATGTYYLLFVADYDNKVNETNETNNVNYRQISVIAPTVDFYTYSGSLSGTPIAGGTINSTVYVYNYGNSTSPSNTLNYYLSTNTTLDGSDVLLASDVINPIPTNTYQSFTKPLTLPNGTTPGTYYIIYVADQTNVVVESSETNNTVATSFTITGPTVDLYPYNYSLSASSIFAGESTTSNLTVYNAGNTVSSTSTAGYYLSTNTVLDVNDVPLGTSNVGAVLQGTTAVVASKNLTMPANTVAGTYYLIVKTDDANAIAESNENNNTTYYTVSVKASGANFTVSSPSVGSTSTYFPGSDMTLGMQVNNTGNLVAGTSNGAFYISANTVLDDADILLDATSVPAISAGAYVSVSKQVKLPFNLTANTYYYIFFVADYDKRVAESTETDNNTYTSIYVQGLSTNLYFSSASVTGVFAPSSVLTATIRLYNQGTVAAAASKVGYYLSANATLDASDRLLDSSSVASVAANNYSSVITKTITVPGNVVPGVYYLLYVADFRNAVLESSEYDNTTYSSLPYIKLNTPNGYDTLKACGQTNITWTSFGLSGYSKLEYSTDGGSTWSLITSYTYNSNSYVWTVPNAISNTVKLRVSDYNNNSYSDASDNNLVIVPSDLKLLIYSPNGGEKLVSGEYYNITYQAPACASTVKIEYSADGGNTWNTISNTASNTGYYSWLIPSIISTNVKVRVSDPQNPLQLFDVSDQNFTIIPPTPYINVTNPYANEQLTAGTNKTLYWSSSNLKANTVSVEYTLDGTTWVSIGSALNNVGYVNWVVPVGNTSLAQVRVKDNGSATMDSSARFSVKYTKPQITFSGNLEQCEGGYLYLYAPSGYGQYTWSNGSTGQSIYVTASGQYSVAVSNGTYKDTSNTVSIQFKTKPKAPVISAVGSTTVCEGETVTINASVDSLANNYFWSNGSTAKSLAVTSTGSYYLTASNNNGCSSNSNYVYVNVLKSTTAKPVITKSGSTDLCYGSSVTLSLPSGYSDYTWSNGSKSSYIYVSQSGKYSCQVSSGQCGTRYSDTVEVKVAPPVAAPTIAGIPSLSFCTGGTARLSVPAIYAKYLWSNGDTTNEILVRNSGYYSVRVSNGGNCWATSNTVYTEEQNPIGAFKITGDTLICGGSYTILSAPSGNYTYLWNNGETSRSIYVSNNGTYNVAVRNTCATTAVTSPNVTVKVARSPLVPTVANSRPLSFCQGDSTVLSVSNTQSGMTYLWSNGTQGNSLKVKTTGTYSVTARTDSGCTKSSASVSVSVSPTPSKPYISYNNNLKLCQGDSTQLWTYSNANGYKWSTGTTAQYIWVKAAGKYAVEVSNTCGKASSDTLQVVVNPKPSKPVVKVSGNNSFCQGENVTLKTDTTVGSSMYWYNNNSLTSTASTATYLATKSGSYTVRLSDVNTGCYAISEAVTISADPKFDFYSDVQVRYLPNGTIKFYVTGDTAQFASYSWSFGDGGTSLAKSPSYGYGAAGWYNVSLTVTDKKGCSGTITKSNYITIWNVYASRDISINTTSSVTSTYFTSAKIGYATLADGSVYYTNDGGLTWSAKTKPTTSSVNKVEYVGTTGYVIANGGYIGYTTNGGTNWTQYAISASSNLYGLSMYAANLGYAVGQNGAIYLFNGTNWYALNSPTSYTLRSVKAVTGGYAYAVGDNGTILKYNGLSWSVLNSGVTTNLKSVEFVTADMGYAVGENGVVLKTINGGQTWTKVILPGSVSYSFNSLTIYGSGSIWIVGENGVIYSSRDGGINWSIFSSGYNSTLAYIYYNALTKSGYYMGAGGKAFVFDSASAVSPQVSVEKELAAPASVSEIVVYPVPAQSELNVSITGVNLTKAKLTLVDLYGKVVATQSAFATDGVFHEVIDLYEVPSGMYLLKVESEGRLLTVKKVMVSK
jgi:trimeric autotransporter adhesin